MMNLSVICCENIQEVSHHGVVLHALFYGPPLHPMKVELHSLKSEIFPIYVVVTMVYF